MARATVEDPIKVHRFRLVIDGFVRAGFSEVTGLKSETEVAKYREGGFNTTEQKSAALTNFPDITLKRGQIIGSTRGGDDDFIDWVKQVFDVAGAGTAANYRKDLDIEQYNSMNQKVRVWRVYNAWPKNHDAFSDLKGEGNDNSMEALVLVHEGYEKIL